MSKYIPTTLRGPLTAIMMMVGVSMWADNVAKIGETEYETLQAAINAATDGQTVTLIANINETETYTIDKALIIDFGEYTVTASHTTSDASSNADKVFDITAGGNLTVIGTTGGVTDATVLGIFNNAGTLTINGGHFTTTNDDYGVVYNNGGTCTVAGGELRGAWAAIYDRTGSVTVNGGTIYGAARGINAKAGTTVNITNGTVSSSSVAVFGEASSTITISGGNISATEISSVYLDGAGANATISGGTINAPWGVQLYAGTSLSFTGGSITATANGVDMKGAGTTATISGGTINAANGVLITDHATLTVNAGASINGTNTAISGNGSEGKGNTNITINGGTMTTGDNAKGVGIYHPQIGGQLTINGGEITGNTAVEVRSGTVSITGGTLTANAQSYSCDSNGDGSTTIGAALAIAQHTTQQNISVAISGGTFTGVKAISESNPQQNDPAPQVTMAVTDGTFNGGITTADVKNFISGGIFSELPDAELCKENFEPVVDAEGHYTAAAEGSAEVMIGDVKYLTIAKAIEVAGSTAAIIILLKNPSATITIPSEANITLTIGDIPLTQNITNAGILNLADGTISGTVTVSAGTVNISGGTFSNTITATGGTVNITDGTFNATISETSPGDVAISGGTFTNLPAASCCATGYIPMKNADTKYNMTNSLTVEDNSELSPFSDLNGDGYKVANATYNRITGMVAVDGSSTQYGTICLPFAITAQLSGVTLYKATSISADKLTLTITQIETIDNSEHVIPAGTPLIFELGAKATTLTVTSNNATVRTTAPAAEPTGDNLLVGTYSATTINTGLESIYYLNGDKFHNAYNSLSVPAYRAYLKTSDSQQASPRVIFIQKNGEASRISCMEAMDDVIAVYDLNGKKQNGLQRGVNIMRQADGSTFKVIVK